MYEENIPIHKLKSKNLENKLSYIKNLSMDMELDDQHFEDSQDMFTQDMISESELKKSVSVENFDEEYSNLIKNKSTMIETPIVKHQIGSVVIDADYTFDGKSMVTASWDNVVRNFSLTNDGSIKLVNEMKGHHNQLNGVSCANQSNIQVSFSKDTTIRIWDARNTVPLVSIIKNNESVCKAIFSLNDLFIISGG
jgi:WD40 repeat protein